MEEKTLNISLSNCEAGETQGRPSVLHWIFTMVGTAIGAGVLYLPIQAGCYGIWPLLIVSVFMFPFIYFSHKAIVDLLMSGGVFRDYSGSLNKHFGVVFGLFINVIFFLTWFFCLAAYSIGLNDNLGIYLKHLGLTRGNLAESTYLSLIVLIVFFGVIRFCETALLKIMSGLSSILVILLFGISVYLIPQWNFDILFAIPKPSEISVQLLMIAPLLIMSFVFFPAMSAMVVAYRQCYDVEGTSEQRLNRVVFHSTWILVLFVLFFIFSCILSLPREAFQTALDQNISCLTLISMRLETADALPGLGTVIGLAALATSFIGVFFAARESAHRIIVTVSRNWFKKKIARDRIDSFVLISLFFLLWGFTVANVSVIAMFGILIAPLVAIFLYILPVVIFYIEPRLKKHRKLVNVLVFFVGVLLLFSYALGSFLEKFLSS